MKQKKLKKNYGYAEVVTSNNLVADTDDLDDFVNGVKELMGKNSIFFLKLLFLFSS